MKFIIEWLSELSENISERYLEETKIRSFLVKETKEIFLNISMYSEIDLDPEYRGILSILRANLQKLGVSINSDSGPFLLKKNKIPNFDINSWMTDFLDSKVYSKGTIENNTGRYFYQFLKNTKEVGKTVQENLELILRHVEVKRERSISKFSSNIDFTDLWLERNYLAAAFAIYACKVNDWRFLNAALKLNQWRMKEFSNKLHDNLKIIFLLSLSEQEISFLELEKCCD